MAKPDPLVALAESIKRKTAPAEPVEPPKPSAYRAPSRIGNRNIAVSLPPDYRKTLMMLKVQTDRSIQDLATEAFNDLFRKHGMPALD